MMIRRDKNKVKGGKKNMCVDPFILGTIVGVFNMLILLVILALITTGKKGK